MATKFIDSGNSIMSLADGLRLAGRGLLGFARNFLTCLDVARQRRHLLTLDDQALKDIGVSRSDAHGEANRGFWDIPKDANL